MRLPLILLFFTLSCTKYAHFEKNTFGLEIKEIKMEISHFKEYPWRVGIRREKVISQSFSFIVDLPRLEIEDLDYLIREKNIDSWVLRVRSEKGADLQDLGSVYVPFESTRKSRGIQQNMPKSLSFLIQYAAAYPSERFRMFNCPAFRHSKRITSFEIEGNNDEFSLIVGQTTPYKDKADPIELRPKTLNGGMNLQGNYFVEIAPFNFVRKTTMGPFKRIPMYISILGEEEVSVPSCAGTHSENL